MRFLPVTVMALWLLLLSLEVHAEPSPGQQILSLSECDDDRHIHDLSDPESIADVFSTITIRIDKDALRSRIPAASASSSLTALLARMRSLQDDVTEGLKALPAMQLAMREWSKSPQTMQDYRTLQKGLRPGLSWVLRISELSRDDPELRGALNRALSQPAGASVMAKVAAIFEVARQQVERMRSELDSVAREEGVYVQLGGWIDDRPQHLKGFDEYPMAETFNVERWQFSLTEDQKKQLSQYQSLAKDANRDGLQKALMDNLKTFREVAPDLMQRVLAGMGECEAGVSQTLRESASSATLTATERAAVSDAVAAVQGEIDSFTNLREVLAEKYRRGGGAYNADGAALLNGINSDLEAVRKESAAVAGRIEAVTGALQERIGTRSDLAGALGKVANAAGSCKARFDEGHDENYDLLKQLVETLVSGQHVDAALLDFGNEVAKLDLGDLPEQTTLPLSKRAQPGETLTVKLAVGTPVPGEGKKGKLNEVEVRQIPLFKVLPHVDTAVGVIFARARGKFQLAPSYSWLFKPGCRSSVLYNRVIDVGFGLNLSALDFNKDFTPELGVGIVASAIRDYIQVGCGYNINDDRFFWFFGIRLPMPTLR